MPSPSTRIEKRPPPDIRGGTVDISDLKLRLDTLLPGRRYDHTIPTEADLKNSKLNKNGKQMAIATTLMERICRTVLSREMRQKCQSLSDYMNVPIGGLMQWDAYMQCCVDMIVATTMTDFRLASISVNMIREWPRPSCFFTPTSFYPLGEGSQQIGNMSTKAWVVLLANAMFECNTNITSAQSILNMIHELYLHAESKDWSQLDDNPITKVLTEDICRFGLASAGIRVARRIFRIDSDQRIENVGDIMISTSSLLDEIEVFSRDQMKYKPHAAIGSFNMGWIAMQCPSKRKTHGLTAAADCYYWFKKAYEVADDAGDDFNSATARIDAAGAIMFGGTGAVGTKRFGSVTAVRRDLRSEFGERARNTNESGHTWDAGDNREARVEMAEIITSQNIAQAKQVLSYEAKRRYDPDASSRLLDSDEFELVEWWNVLKLWNEAMKYYDKVTKIKFQYFVYGETSMWTIVIAKLEDWVENQKLEIDDWPCPRDETGLPRIRDKGERNCASCLKGNSLKLCSRCKSVNYCSRACQKKHWPKHKKECQKMVKRKLLAERLSGYEAN